MNQNAHGKFLPVLAALLVSSTLIGCSGGSEAPQAAAKTQDQSPLQVLEMPRTPAPEDARVYFINLQDGDIVASPLTLQFGAENITIATAGSYEPATGHHHLLIDADLPPLNQVFPANDNHVHFGGGQVETTVELEPGTHTLQLLLGDGHHVPHEPPVMSEKITITVE